MPYADPEKRRQFKNEYNNKNREHIRKACRESYKKHKESTLQRCAEYRASYEGLMTQARSELKKKLGFTAPESMVETFMINKQIRKELKNAKCTRPSK